MFDNLKLIWKLALPVVVLVATALGLVAFAIVSMAHLSAVTRRVVDTDAARATTMWEIQSATTEVSNQTKNAILESQDDERRGFEVRHTTARSQLLTAADHLIALSGTSGQRAMDEALKGQIQLFLAADEKVLALAMKNDSTGAFTLNKGTSRGLRNHLSRTIQDRLDAVSGALLAAKDSALNEQRRAAWLLLVIAAVGLTGSLVLLAGILALKVVRPLKRMTGSMDRLAANDLDVEVVGTARRDELGVLARALDVFKRNALAARVLVADQQAAHAAKEVHGERLGRLVGGFEGTVGQLVGALSSASTELEATARSMSGTASAANERVAAVETAAEAACAGVQTVATAAEELSASITEISRRMTDSSRITAQAVTEARRADGIMLDLADCARRIGDVVGLITQIAGQTNLLALNATIEAARAGDAGKGFAVVASEVKSLAQQTGKATEEIGAQISQIQTATGQAVEAIKGIAATIEEVSTIATAIAGAVEEQGAATAEIAQHVQQTATSTLAVTANIAGVRQAANDTGTAAHQVLGAAGALSKQAEDLTREVNGFAAGVRAA